MKTKKERNKIKEEAETLNKKPRKLTGEELAEVTGGVKGGIITFRIDAPAGEETDVVELNITNVSLAKGGVIVPAQIEIPE